MHNIHVHLCTFLPYIPTTLCQSALTALACRLSTLPRLTFFKSDVISYNTSGNSSMDLLLDLAPSFRVLSLVCSSMSLEHSASHCEQSKLPSKNLNCQNKSHDVSTLQWRWSPAKGSYSHSLTKFLVDNASTLVIVAPILCVCQSRPIPHLLVGHVSNMSWSHHDLMSRAQTNQAPTIWASSSQYLLSHITWAFVPHILHTLSLTPFQPPDPCRNPDTASNPRGKFLGRLPASTWSLPNALAYRLSICSLLIMVCLL
jgi:hypothetical protein